METSNQKVKADFSSDLKKELCLKWEKSGLKKVEFAKLNQINKSTFYSWFTEKEKKTASSKKSDKILNMILKC